MFYSGYSHGFVLLNIKQKLKMHFHSYGQPNAHHFSCRERTCITVRRYWTVPEVKFINGSALPGVTSVAPSVLYPNSICLHPRYREVASQLLYDISAGSGNFVLGHIHIRSYMACDVVQCSMHGMYSQQVISSGSPSAGRSVRLGELRYDSSYMIDHEVPNALFIRMHVTVLNPFNLYFYFAMEKVEGCRYHADIGQISMVSHKCKQINIPFHNGHALFLIKNEHRVTVSIHPDCDGAKTGGLHLDMIMHDVSNKFDLVWQDSILMKRPLEIVNAGLLNISWDTLDLYHRSNAHCSIVIKFVLKTLDSFVFVDGGSFKQVASNGSRYQTELGYDEFLFHDMYVAVKDIFYHVF